MPSPKKKFVYSDIDPFLSESPSGDLSVHYDAEAVFRSLRNIMATVSGERVRNPVGSRLLGFLFEPVSDDVAEDIIQEIRRVVSQYEPRVTNLKIRATPRPDENQYDIKMRFGILGIDGVEVMNVPLRAFV